MFRARLVVHSRSRKSPTMEPPWNGLLQRMTVVYRLTTTSSRSWTKPRERGRTPAILDTTFAMPKSTVSLKDIRTSSVCVLRTRWANRNLCRWPTLLWRRIRSVLRLVRKTSLSRTTTKITSSWSGRPRITMEVRQLLVT
uniref:(northern house mosquito) hypothetical protein n=1 Tax=Culex pipiens TaxID=7175 RepID=A0A8D8MIL1_CULPI